jgi:hypothetical protein
MSPISALFGDGNVLVSLERLAAVLSRCCDIDQCAAEAMIGEYIRHENNAARLAWYHWPGYSPPFDRITLVQ